MNDLVLPIKFEHGFDFSVFVQLLQNFVLEKILIMVAFMSLDLVLFFLSSNWSVQYPVGFESSRYYL